VLADASGIDCARLLGMLGSRSPATNDDSVGGAVSGAELFGLIVSILVAIYLLYALLRGERL
jgi:K+-transporting ATPase KdpF subunit